MNIRVNATRRHLRALAKWQLVHIDMKNDSEMIELMENGQRFLKLPNFGLFSKHGLTKLSILQTLLTGRKSLDEIHTHLGIKYSSIRNHLNGKRLQNGKNSQGLLHLGLVKRMGYGGSSDPYVYGVTDKGKWFIKEITKLFPNLATSNNP